jgi:hypothetical protein
MNGLLEVAVTNHAKDRTKERLGLSKKCAEKNAQKAFEYGVKHSEVTGSLRRYLDSVYLRHRNSNNTRIYNRKLYLYNENILVTIMNLPNKYSELADKLQRKKNGV